MTSVDNRNSNDPPHSVVKAVTARKDELTWERSSIGRAACARKTRTARLSVRIRPFPTKTKKQRKGEGHTMANFNLNKVIIGGRLTADPELKQTQSGTAVTTFTVAVNRRGAKDGQQQSDFISCVAWKERAELVTKYFGKGSSICVEGEIQTRSWKDESGNNRYATEVNASQVHFVDSKSENPANSAPSVIPGYTGPQQAPSFTPATPPKFEEMDKDDQLPF